MADPQPIQASAAHARPAALPDIPAIGPRMTYARDEEIFGEGEPSDFVYQVLSGVVRTCRFHSDGRRQIDEFHLAGEYFGLELDGDHTCSAEALGPVTVLLLRRSTLGEIAARDPAVSRQLLDLSLRTLRRSHRHLNMLGLKGACERVAAFLVDFAQRSGSAAFIELPMSRQDIADYLGLTIETVSRTFTQLEADGVIGLPDRRRVLVRDPQQLRGLCA